MLFFKSVLRFGYAFAPYRFESQFFTQPSYRVYIGLQAANYRGFDGVVPYCKTENNHSTRSKVPALFHTDSDIHTPVSHCAKDAQ